MLQSSRAILERCRNEGILPYFSVEAATVRARNGTVPARLVVVLQRTGDVYEAHQLRLMEEKKLENSN